MDISELVQLLKEMVAIPSVSREEQALADHLQARLEAAGLSVCRKGANLWIEEDGRGDGRPVLLLNGHIDTVRAAAGYSRDPYIPYEENGRIYGLGTNDDAASVLACSSPS